VLFERDEAAALVMGHYVSKHCQCALFTLHNNAPKDLYEIKVQ
jgi:hypothetical protein